MQARILRSAILLHPCGETREYVDIADGDGAVDVAIHLLAPDAAGCGDLALPAVRMRLQVRQRRVADIEYVGSKYWV